MLKKLEKIIYSDGFFVALPFIGLALVGYGGVLLLCFCS